MTTTATPATPSTTPGVTSDFDWIKLHLATLILLCLLGFGMFWGTESIIAKHDAARASEYQASLNVAIQSVKDAQTQAKTQDDQLLQLIQSVASENQQLATQIAARDKVAVQAQQKAATLNAVDTASAISTTLKASVGEVTAQSDDVVFDLPMARTVNENLIKLGQVQADLVSTQQSLVNETSLQNKTTLDLDDQKKIVAAQAVQITDGDKACKTELASVKANAKKNEVKWFGIGVVAGFISGVTAHLW